MAGSRLTAKRRTPRRGGFTLVEMLLVLGVLVVFAGMTVPSVMRMFSQQKVTGAAELVRSAIANARFRAIESGLIYQFCCESDGSRFVVVPFEPDQTPVSGSSQAVPTPRAGRLSGHLPKGIRFTSAVTKSMGNAGPPTHKLSSVSLEGLPNAGDLASANWSAPILFHPEGSANADRELSVSDTKGQHVSLRVRAFTGAVSLDRLVAGKR